MEKTIERREGEEERDLDCNYSWREIAYICISQFVCNICIKKTYVTKANAEAQLSLKKSVKIKITKVEVLLSRETLAFALVYASPRSSKRVVNSFMVYTNLRSGKKTARSQVHNEQAHMNFIVFYLMFAAHKLVFFLKKSSDIDMRGNVP